MSENVKEVDVTVWNPSKPDRKYRVISLFSGAGGMDLGFEGGFTVFNQDYADNPFEIVHASDINKPATLAYNHNFETKADCIDITELDLDTLPEADVVIGGFPCQPFSHAGKREGFDDDKGRGTLYLEMKRVIEHVRPKMFIAENVDGLRTKKVASMIPGEADVTALDQVVKDFADSGYNVVYKILKAVDYGIPQTRVRVIIIGKRMDVSGDIMYPLPTHGESLLPYRTSYDALEDLWGLLDVGKVSNHTTADYSKAKFRPGSTSQGNAQVPENRPAQTVRAEAHGNVYAHYKGDSDDMTTWRRLTARECARLQSFPDSYVFPGSQSSAHRQIGNAVPPVLAWFVARACAKFLEESESDA